MLYLKEEVDEMESPDEHKKRIIKVLLLFTNVCLLSKVKENVVPVGKQNRSSRADTKETNEALAESWHTSTVRKAPEYTAGGRHGNSTIVEVSNISWT